MIIRSCFPCLHISDWQMKIHDHREIDLSLRTYMIELWISAVECWISIVNHEYPFSFAFGFPSIPIYRLYQDCYLFITFIYLHGMKQWYSTLLCINTLRPRQNGRHFPDDIFKSIFLNENVLVSINISLKFVPRGPINNIPTKVQVMAWRRSSDKPLSEPMVVRLPTHKCVTRPQWVEKSSRKNTLNVQHNS